MPRSCASFSTAVMSSGFITEPDGLLGEFRMMTFVRGVMARSTMSAVSAKSCFSSVAMYTGSPPA